MTSHPQSIMFNAVFGITPGYGGLNLFSHTDALAKVSIAWQTWMKAEQNVTGILVTAVLTEANVVYPTEFGCPIDGEIAVQATGVWNPKFNVAPYDWKQSVLRIVWGVKSTLQQERVTLFFQHTESFHYLEGNAP